MALIKLSEYAEKHGLTIEAVKAMALRKRFKTLTGKGGLRYVDEDEPYPATVDAPPVVISDETLREIGKAYKACLLALGWQNRPVDAARLLHPWMMLTEIMPAIHQNDVVKPWLGKILRETFDLCDGNEETLEAAVPLERQGAWWVGYYSNPYPPKDSGETTE